MMYAVYMNGIQQGDFFYERCFACNHAYNIKCEHPYADVRVCKGNRLVWHNGRRVEDED